MSLDPIISISIALNYCDDFRSVKDSENKFRILVYAWWDAETGFLSGTLENTQLIF